MTHRVDECWMLNHQYERVERLKHRFSEVEDSQRSRVQKGVDKQSDDGRNQVKDGLLALKAVGDIFSGWDHFLHNKTFQNGHKDHARRQYFHPWWTQAEDATPTNFGNVVNTRIAAFSVNATFEALSRLTFASLNHQESILEDRARIASLEAWRETFCQASFVSAQARKREAEQEKEAAAARSTSHVCRALHALEVWKNSFEMETLSRLTALSESVGRQDERWLDVSAQHRNTEAFLAREVDAKVHRELYDFRRHFIDPEISQFQADARGREPSPRGANVPARDHLSGSDKAAIERRLTEKIQKAYEELRILDRKVYDTCLRHASKEKMLTEMQSLTQRLHERVSVLEDNLRDVERRMGTVGQLSDSQRHVGDGW